MTERKANHLQSENSPYLLQHALNPVDWYPWGEEALDRARLENRLLVISIGYAACHWCHVMEHESFENEEVAALMNAHFIPVKVDREERPDIDQVYMNAAHAMGGRGGWPLSVIALPDQRPVFAGTYFTRQDWMQVLAYFATLYATQPDDLQRQAAEITAGMKRMIRVPGLAEALPEDSGLLREILAAWKEDLDFVNGGMRGAPKFPMPSGLESLLQYGILLKDAEASDHARLTLGKMAMGGLYDQLGGGFSRYSVDGKWHIPHFEKMLYDNAQMIGLYSEAWALDRRESYRRVVEESIGFILRELTGHEGIFYSSLDADSEGREGAFYAWKAHEIEKYLGESAVLFMEYYSCTEDGNWENGLNVLKTMMPREEFAGLHGIDEEEFSSFLDVCRDQLLTVRDNRPRPATDDKALTCWNGLMISALAKAAARYGRQDWQERAIRAATFYLDGLDRRNGSLWRNFKAGSFAIHGFLDDYAFLADAFLTLYQSTLDPSWLEASERLMKTAIRLFSAPDGVFFNLSSSEAPPLVTETVELSDNVIPASNSVMASNLRILGILLGMEEYAQRSELMIRRMIPSVRQNPAFHANWAAVLAFVTTGPVEVSIIGDACGTLLRELQHHYLPGVIISGGPVKTISEKEATRHIPGKTLIYVCRERSCFAPVETVQEALGLLNG